MSAPTDSFDRPPPTVTEATVPAPPGPRAVPGEIARAAASVS